MSFTAKFFLFQTMILVPFVSGYLTKRRYGNPETFTKRLIRLNLIVVEPLIVLWSIWGLTLKTDLAFLPLAGLLMVLCGLFLGTYLVPLLKHSGRARGSFIISASIANHGFTMGGFLCYIFLGEKGLGLSFIFITYFIPYLFLVIFPYARLVATGERYKMLFVSNFLLNPQNMPLYAIIAAILLRVMGFERPRIFFPIDLLLMLSIAVYYFALGVNFLIRDLFAFNRDNLLLCSIRFLLVPLITMLILTAVHLDPDVEAVILIESCMPVAVYSVMSSVLFDLDAKRASSMFVFNTIVFLAVVFPCLFWFKGILLRIIA